LSRAVADEEPEPGAVVAEVHHEVAGCWVVQGPSGCAVTPRRCRERLLTSITNRA
jgi:hypothetical protein